MRCSCSSASLTLRARPPCGSRWASTLARYATQGSNPGLAPGTPATHAFEPSLGQLLVMLCCSAAFNLLVARWPASTKALQLADHAGMLLAPTPTLTNP